MSFLNEKTYIQLNFALDDIERYAKDNGVTLSTIEAIEAFGRIKPVLERELQIIADQVLSDNIGNC